MKRAFLNAVSSAVLLAAAGGCAESVPTTRTPRTLDAVAADVRIHAYVIGEHGDPPIAKRLIVTLERWSGNAGNGLPRLPVVPGRARQGERRRDPSSYAGGEWNDLEGCTLPVFSIEVAALPHALDAEQIVVEIADTSLTLRMVTTNMFVAPKVSWKAPADGALHAGDVAQVAITPAPQALILDELFYLPDGPDAAVVGHRRDHARASPPRALLRGARAARRDRIDRHRGRQPADLRRGRPRLRGRDHVLRPGAPCVDDACDGYSPVPLSLDEPVYLPATVASEGRGGRR